MDNGLVLQNELKGYTKGVYQSMKNIANVMYIHSVHLRLNRKEYRQESGQFMTLLLILLLFSAVAEMTLTITLP